MKNINLRLLTVVSEVSRTRSVSQAGANLELSQSAVSMNLAKLRKHFNDPLFVKTSNGMEPTPHGTELISLLRKAEDLLQTAFEHHVVFDPATSDRTFHLYSTDIAQVTLLPKLMEALRERAPYVRVELTRISDGTAKLLESGAADLAVGFILPMGSGFCQQRLFKERFVCAFRADHPRIHQSLSLEQFEAESHLAVRVSGTGHGILDRALESKRIKRRVSVVVPSFLGIASIITSTDSLAILPEQLVRHLVRTHANIAVAPLPFQVPSYVIMQHWHERYTYDPANKWLRSLIAELFLTS